MSHLSLEDLARLLDEPSTSDEAAHLAACAACRDELDAMRAELRELRRLGPLAPPAGAWDTLAARLVRDDALAPRAGWRRPLLRLAAALAIFALGGLAGALARGAPAAAPLAEATRAPAPTAAPPAPTGATGAVTSPAAPRPSEPAEPEPSLAAEPAEDEAGVEPAVAARTPEDAARAVESAERAYLVALTRYAEMASPTAPEREAVARLAALESIVLTTRAALNEAPADPIINGYHLAALAQRDAAIRQVAAKGTEPWF